MKTIGLMRKVRHRGREPVEWMFTWTATIYNLLRMRNLLGLPPQVRVDPNPHAIRREVNRVGLISDAASFSFCDERDLHSEWYAFDSAVVWMRRRVHTDTNSWRR